MSPIFMLSIRTAVLILCFMLGFTFPQSSDNTRPDNTLSAETFVKEIYKMVSATGATIPDWKNVRSCFLDEAVIVLRSSRNAHTVHSVDGFIEDFIKFYETPYGQEKKKTPRETGFTETVVKLKSMEYWDMAQVLVLYEAKVTGSGRPPQQGIDSWSLIRRDGQWFIAAVTNEIVTSQYPLPTELSH